MLHGIDHRLVQRLLYGSVLGQIADDAGEHPAGPKVHFAHREVHRERGAILSLSNDLAPEADNPRLPGFQIMSQVAVMLLAKGGWHQHVDVPSNDLVGLVAEKPLGRGIERLDAAPFIDDDNPVHRRRHNGLQPSLTIPYGLLSTLTLGDVDDGT